MRQYVIAILALPLVAGCMSPAPMTSRCWVVEYDRAQWPGRHEAQWPGRHEGQWEAQGEGKMPVVRVARVDVSAPYDGKQLVVLRGDGTLALDAYNVFSAPPSVLLQAAAEKQLMAGGRFSQVVPSYSAAESKWNLEIDVSMMGLDCRAAGEKSARVELLLTVVEGRKVISSSEGIGVAESKGDFSVAFSTAFVQALAKALDGIKVQ